MGESTGGLRQRLNQTYFLPVPLDFKFFFEKFKEIVFAMRAGKFTSELGKNNVLLLRGVKAPFNE